MLRVISPLAEGADRLVAKEAIALGFELQCPLPFTREEYQRDFESAQSRQEFCALIALATAVLELDGSRERRRVLRGDRPPCTQSIRLADCHLEW